MRHASLQGRLARLYESLEAVPADESADGPLITVYNTLLTLARQERPDDAVLSKLSEVNGGTSAGTVRVLVGQVIAAFE